MTTEGAMMRSIEFIQRVNHLTDQEEVFAVYRAIRQDPLVWTGFQSLIGQDWFEPALVDQNRKADPGSLALLSIDQNVQFLQFPLNTFPRELFEEIMFNFESYVSGNEVVSDLREAALLAAALLEKRKISGSWKTIITELQSRMSISSAADFKKRWGTVFGIIANLSDRRDELFNDLM